MDMTTEHKNPGENSRYEAGKKKVTVPPGQPTLPGLTPLIPDTSGLVPGKDSKVTYQETVKVPVLAPTSTETKSPAEIRERIYKREHEERKDTGV